jgi:LDH2 family malate/lactate/ureidoglycolate dehydrogenase
LVLDIKRFAPLETVKSEISMMVDYVKETPLAEGFDQILYPGEKEAKSRKARNKRGVEIEDDTWNQAMALVKEYNLADKIGKLP